MGTKISKVQILSWRGSLEPDQSSMNFHNVINFVLISNRVDGLTQQPPPPPSPPTTQFLKLPVLPLDCSSALEEKGYFSEYQKSPEVLQDQTYLKAARKLL